MRIINGLAGLALAASITGAGALHGGRRATGRRHDRIHRGRRRRAAQRGRGEAAGAAGGGAQAGDLGQGEADQARRQHRRQARLQGPRRGGPVRRARAREDRQDLRRARRVRRQAPPGVPGPGHRQEHRGPRDVQRTAAQQDPGAGPGQGQLDRLAGGLRPRPLRAAVLRRGRGRGVAQDVLRAPVLGPLQRRRPRHRLGEGPVQRGALRPQQRLPVRGQRLLEHVDADQGRDRRVGRRPEGRRPDGRGDQGRPGVL